MSKASQRTILLLPLILLLLGGGYFFLSGPSDSDKKDHGFAPEDSTLALASDPASQNIAIQSPIVEQRLPESQAVSPAPVPELAAPHTGFRFVSRILRVPLSYAFFTTEDQPDDARPIGENGSFTPAGGILPKHATLLDSSRTQELAVEKPLTVLPEGRVLFTEFCTLLIDSPAGALPKINQLHVAFISKTERLRAAHVISIEAGPKGWVIRIQEDAHFFEKEALDRILLCIDPPVKDHVRIASWSLSELRVAKVKKLEPLPTHTLPLTWKGLASMGNVASEQELVNVIFSGNLGRPGFHSAAAIDWLAAPPTRGFSQVRDRRTYDRVPQGVAHCSAFFARGSVGQIDLPSTDVWKFAIELFPDAVQDEIARSALQGQKKPHFLATVRPDEMDTGGLQWAWGEGGELMHAASYAGAESVDTILGDPDLSGFGRSPIAATLSTVVMHERHLISKWTPHPGTPGYHPTRRWTDPTKRHRFHLVNQTQWRGKGTLFLLSMDEGGVSLRPIRFNWPQDRDKWFRANVGEFAWFATSPTGQGAFGLLGQEPDFESHETPPKKIRDYDLDLNFSDGWSSVLMSDWVGRGSHLQDKVLIQEISNAISSDNIQALSQNSPLGGSVAISSVNSAPLTTQLGPWGVKLLSSDAPPVYLEFGFQGGPTTRLQPNKNTRVIILKLTLPRSDE